MRLIRKLGFVVSSFGMCISCKCNPEQVTEQVRYAAYEALTAWPVIASSMDGSCMLGHYKASDNIHCFFSVGPEGIRAGAMMQFVPGTTRMKIITPKDVKIHPDKYHVPQYVLDALAVIRELRRCRKEEYDDDIVYDGETGALECYDGRYSISFDKKGNVVKRLSDGKGEFGSEILDPFRDASQVIEESFGSANEGVPGGGKRTSKGVKTLSKDAKTLDFRSIIVGNELEAKQEGKKEENKKKQEKIEAKQEGKKEENKKKQEKIEAKQEGKKEENKKKQEKIEAKQEGKKENNVVKDSEVSGALNISNEQPLPDKVDAKDFINAVKGKDGENLFGSGESPAAGVKIDGSLKEEATEGVDAQRWSESVTSDKPQIGVEAKSAPETQKREDSSETLAESLPIDNETQKISGNQNESFEPKDEINMASNEPQDSVETQENSEVREPAEVNVDSSETLAESLPIDNETQKISGNQNESFEPKDEINMASNEPQDSVETQEPVAAAENYVENDQSGRSFLDEIQSERTSSASLADSLSEEGSREALSGGKSYEMKENYQDVDYEDFAKEIGHYYAKLDSSEKWYLETQMKRNRWPARKSLEDVSMSSDNDSQHHDLRESNVQHAEVPNAWSERPDFASSPDVPSALFQVGGVNNSPNFPLTDSKMPLKQNGAGHSNGFPRLVEKGGKKWLVVDARKIFVRADQAPASMQLAGVSQDTKELDVPSHGESTSAPEVFFMHKTSTSITLGHCFYTYISMPKGMVAPERVEALFVPSVK